MNSNQMKRKQKYENQSPLDEANPRDEEGRMKLLASVSRGSICLFFFVLMWRSVHHYELADQSFKNSIIARPIFVIPTIILFIGNMTGCVASITSQSHSSKKRMKAILNLNKLAELMIFLYNILRLAIIPNKYIPREIYIGRTLTNFMFMIQLQVFTRVTWGAAQIKHDAFNVVAQDISSSHYPNQAIDDTTYIGNDTWLPSHKQELDTMVEGNRNTYYNSQHEIYDGRYPTNSPQT